jgi:hypothetical protein
MRVIALPVIAMRSLPMVNGTLAVLPMLMACFRALTEAGHYDTGPRSGRDHTDQDPVCGG